MRLSVAPMEGLTGVVFRRIHHQFYGPAGEYFIPFITPTQEPRFTDRQLRELQTPANAGLTVVPQLLTRNSADFIWAAEALADLGYGEVNLNLGCPAGTVVAKRKGAGFLRFPTELQAFLDAIFSADLPIRVSVKTRLGWSQTYEFEDLVQLFNRYPMDLLIVHPRLKTDMYRGSVRLEVLDALSGKIQVPWGYNGDIVTVQDYAGVLAHYPQAAMVMIGRGLMADPALLRKIQGGAETGREELKEYTSALFEAYAQVFDSEKNAVMRMKEMWFYLLNLFEDSPKQAKRLFKSQSGSDYRDAVSAVFSELELKQEARMGWKKPLPSV